MSTLEIRERVDVRLPARFLTGRLLGPREEVRTVTPSLSRATTPPVSPVPARRRGTAGLVQVHLVGAATSASGDGRQTRNAADALIVGFGGSSHRQRQNKALAELAGFVVE